MKNTGKRVLAAAMMCFALMGSAAASADGNVPFTSYDGYYDNWTNADGLGGVSLAEQYSVSVISKNASVWSQPRTNSKKLGSVKHAQTLQVRVNADTPIYESGFYAVEYNGANGWINSEYVVLAPYEIVLMQSNVPAYCAPSRNAKKVGSLSKLTRYTVLGFYRDYYVISLREAAAFVPMSVQCYDTVFERNYHAGMHTQGTTTGKTTLRTGPGSDYASVKDVRSGYRFTCFDVIDGWYLTDNPDGDGYVYINGNDAVTDKGW